MDARYKILIADKLNEEGIELLRQFREFEVAYKPQLDEESFCREVAGAHAVIVRSGVKVTSKVIDCGHCLKVIGRAGVGVDNIDVDRATARGILVMNNPTGNATTTAEHTLGLIFSLARMIPQAHASMAAGRWEKGRFQGVELTGKRLGIIGLGNIGKIVAEKARGVGLKVTAHDPFVSEETARLLGVELVSLEDLLKTSDIVTLHVPLTPSTKMMIDAVALAKMKKGAFLINCARGGLVDEMALYAALQEGRLGGAALDVWEKEPPPSDHPLLKLPNVVATPHLGASTKEAQVGVALGIAEQVADYLLKGTIRYAVNMPSILPETLELLRPFMDLVEKMGSFIVQMRDDGLTEVEVRYSGELPAADLTILNLALMKGILSPALGERVTLINAGALLRERGIKFTESRTEAPRDYANLITVTAHRPSFSDTISAVVFGRNIPKIVRINDFFLEADPGGHIIMVESHDRPGVIGRMGTLMGEEGINIASMTIGRDRPGGMAISLMHVDPPVPDGALAGLRLLPDVVSARLLKV